MKTLTLFVVLSLFAISNGEVLQNPHLSRPNWNPEKITGVDITLRKAASWLHETQLRVDIYHESAELGLPYHCFFPVIIGRTETIASISGSVIEPCSSLEIDESSNVTVEVQLGESETNDGWLGRTLLNQIVSNRTFNIFDVMITTEHSAQFQAMFPNEDYDSQLGTGRQIANVFFPSSSVPINSLFNTEVNCTGLTESTDHQTMSNSCASNRMHISGISGQHYYLCGPGCARVKNLDIYEQGNGYRCFESATLQDNSQYCCLDGQCGGVPGCEQQVVQGQEQRGQEEPTNNPLRNINTPNHLHADQGTEEQGCSAVGGPGNALPCVFPFKIGGRVWNTCASPVDNTNNRPWCSTRVDETGNHITGNWGNCDENCPLPQIRGRPY